MKHTNPHGDDFNPMLFPNEAVGYEVVTKPMMASYKLDGMRCIFKNGQMLSRQFKPILNKQLNERFAKMKELTKDNPFVFDGELYSHDIDFGEIMHYCRTEDLGDEPLPDSIKFYCFDRTNVIMANEIPAHVRYMVVQTELANVSPYVEVLEQRTISTPEEAKAMFEEAVAKGYEGLILKDPNSFYKHGRISTTSGDGYKFKPYQTWDARIIAVEQATEVAPTAEKKKTEYGYSKTSRKKGDRIPVEKASAFTVLYDGKLLKVSLAMTYKEKEQVWREKDSYIGKTIEYKGMLVGAKDVPRHPVFVRMRPDKDEGE
jgi:DNA ligase-1